MSTQGSARQAGPLRIGYLGGGPGSNIGETHRTASRLDNLFTIVCGIFSTDSEKNRAMADDLGIAADRRYASPEEMAAAEADRPDGIDVVGILTPNSLHAPMARPFLERGIHVLCEKPVTTSYADAVDLVQRANRHRCVCTLAHAYAYYTMVHEARARLAAGEIGEIRLIEVEYASGYAARPLEREGVKRMIWRMDPAVGGPSAAIGDLGTHAHHLARFVTGHEITEVSADVSTVVPGRTADDNAHILFRTDRGARGMLWATTAAAGNGNGLRLRVFGETGSVVWEQEEPERMLVRALDSSERIVKRGDPSMGAAGARLSRLRPGQPEGFLEAFANLYRDTAILIHARRQGTPVNPLVVPPTLIDGAVGMGFVEACLASSAAHGKWTAAPTPSDVDAKGGR